MKWLIGLLLGILSIAVSIAISIEVKVEVDLVEMWRLYLLAKGYNI